MKKSLVITLSAICLLVPAQAFSQFSLSLAPTTGMNFNIHSGSDLPETGTGFGFVIGGAAEMMFNETMGLLGRITFYDNRSGSYSRTGSEQGVNYTVDVSASVAYLEIEPLFKLQLPRVPIYFLVGPALGFNIEGSAEATVKITTPGYTFPDGSTSMKSKESLKDMLVRFELKMGAGYNIELARDLYISPEVSFGYGLTKVQSDVSWRILTIQALGSVKFVVI